MTFKRACTIAEKRNKETGTPWYVVKEVDYDLGTCDYVVASDEDMDTWFQGTEAVEVYW